MVCNRRPIQVFNAGGLRKLEETVSCYGGCKIVVSNRLVHGENLHFMLKHLCHPRKFPCKPAWNGKLACCQDRQLVGSQVMFPRKYNTERLRALNLSFDNHLGHPRRQTPYTHVGVKAFKLRIRESAKVPNIGKLPS